MMFVLLSTFILAQTNVTGVVVDSNNTPIPGANVVFDSTTGAVADFNGEFSIDVDASPPFSLTISSIGFETTSITVTDSGASVSVTLSDSENLLDEVVLSASRSAQSLFESPVTIERFDYTDIAASTGADFYQSLEALKGIQVISTGIINQTINARGFSSAWNEGFVQLVDGMNNEAPGLNFSAGNLAGVNELDLFNIEFLPGASSALYGPNAYKGILTINTKNPFDFQGFSAYLTQGVTSQDVAGDNHYYDFGMRFAHAFSDKFAVKATLGYVKGKDWQAANYNDWNTVENAFIPGTLEIADQSLFPDYDGINVYGEQSFGNVPMTDVFLGSVLPGLAAQAGLSPGNVAFIGNIFTLFAPNYFGSQVIHTTGYSEAAVDPTGDASNFKFNIAGHYRFNGNSELIFMSNVGRGNTILQGAARYKMLNFGIQQHKLEYRTKNFTARVYKTIESSGNTFQFDAMGGYLFAAQPGGPGAFAQAYFGTYFQNGRMNKSELEIEHPNYFIHSECTPQDRCVSAFSTFHTDTQFSLRQENVSASLINSYELEDYNNLYERGLMDHIVIFNESSYPMQFHTADRRLNKNEPVSPKNEDLIYLDTDMAVRIDNDEAGRVFIKRPHTVSGYTVKYSIVYKVTGYDDIIK